MSYKNVLSEKGIVLFPFVIQILKLRFLIFESLYCYIYIIFLSRFSNVYRFQTVYILGPAVSTEVLITERRAQRHCLGFQKRSSGQSRKAASVVLIN